MKDIEALILANGDYPSASLPLRMLEEAPYVVCCDGGANAAILAAKILATSDPDLLERLKAYTKEMKETVQAKAAKLDELGHKEYLKQM